MLDVDRSRYDFMTWRIRCVLIGGVACSHGWDVNDHKAVLVSDAAIAVRGSPELVERELADDIV